MYLLDTNACIHAMRARAERVFRRYEAAVRARTALAIPAISVFELWHGATNSQRVAQNIRLLKQFLGGPLTLLAFDDEDARTAGEIRTTLRRAGTPIGPYDVLIAAQAVRRNLILVTADVGEFGRVPGLRWEDWSKG